MLGNTPLRYGFRTRLLHWLIALLILVLIGLGWWMVGLSYYDTWYHDATSLHEGLGVVAWVLAIVLVAGNLLNKPPKSLPLSWWEKPAAWAAHKLLYVAILGLPVAGYLISTADGNPLSVFGLFEIEAIWAKDKSVRDAAIFVHTYGGYGMLGLVAMHGGAALKHHVINKDRTLLRMILGR